MLEILQGYIVRYSSVVLLSILPILIWWALIKGKDPQTRSALKKAFLFGILFSIPIVAIQHIWLVGDNFTLDHLVKSNSQNFHIGFILTTMGLALVEEATKLFSLINLKWFKIKIKSVKQATGLIVSIALGFSFTENATYIFAVLQSIGFENIFSELVTRLLLVTFSQMLFSAVVVYYFVIGKFGNPILALDSLTGRKHKISKFLSQVFRTSTTNIFYLKNISLGLFIATFLHALFNSMLLFNKTNIALSILLLTSLTILYLNQKKTSYLVFEDEKHHQNSKNEKKIIIKLISKWLDQKRYSEVIDYCDRLIIKDPKNNLLKLIKAKAVDKKNIQRIKDFLKKIFFRKKETNPIDIFNSEKYQNTDEIGEDKKSRKENSLGLVLGGGGLRGCLHLGFYQVLQEEGIKVDYLTGTSMGAVMGSAIALGQDIELIKNKALAQKDINAFSFKNLSFIDEGFVKQEFLTREVRLFTEDKSFADLKIPFACEAMNLENGEMTTFTDGMLEPAVAASAALPLVFPPVYYRNIYYVDGGVKNDLPCGACRRLGAKKVVAVSIQNNIVKQRISGEIFRRHFQKPNPLLKKLGVKDSGSIIDKKRKDLNFFMDILSQTLSTAASCCYQQELERSKPDLLIEVLCEYDLFDFEYVDEIIEIGRKAAKQNLEKIKKLIEK